MRSLIYLHFTKIKGKIRNQFRSLFTGLAIIAVVLFYGGFMLLSFKISDGSMSQAYALDMDKAVLAGMGIVALLSFTVMLSRRKALVLDTDAYYLFSGPYSRKQVNGYVAMQSGFQSVFYSLLGCYTTAVLAMRSYFSLFFFLLCFVVYALCLFFFLILTDYIYMWGLAEKKYKVWIYAPPFLILGWAAAAFLLSMKKADWGLEGGALDFIQGRAFYGVPFFGWGKWALDSFLEQKYLLMLPGLGLLLFFNALLVWLFLRFDKDIAEEAMEDAESISAYMRKLKENGGRSVQTQSKKAGKIRGSFREGAWAVFSKNILLMRKSGNFLRKQDIFTILFYFIISRFSGEKSFYMFCYMLILWLFTMIQDSELLRDLKNYQIYLIPEDPGKKLLGVMLPACFRIEIVLSAAVLFAGVITRISLGEILLYLCMLLGYSLIFVAGTVLSVRVFGSGNSVVLESFLRFVMILISAIPSGAAAAVLAVVLTAMGKTEFLLGTVTAVTLVMNFLVSILVIVSCKGMMNGGKE